MSDATPPHYPGDRIFQTFRRWPLVPTQDLQRLRAALLQCVAAEDSETAQQLLGLVEDELHRRRKQMVSFAVAERNRPKAKMASYRRAGRKDFSA